MSNKVAAFVFAAFCLLSGTFAFSQDREDALVLFKQGNYARAVEVCIQEINATPGNTDSYIVLGWSLIAQRRYQETLDYMTKGMDTVGPNSWILKNIGDALYYLGRPNEALVRFEQFVSSGVTSDAKAETYYLMGEIYYTRRELILADTAISAACAYRASRGDWWRRLGVIREEQGDFSASLAAFIEAVRLNQNDQDALRGRDRVKARIQG
jgi:tetratricopeptide (TPR) repeat protein